MNINTFRKIKMCEGPDLNRGTPARTDLESVAFDRAWLPSHGALVTPDAILNVRKPVRARTTPIDERVLTLAGEVAY